MSRRFVARGLAIAVALTCPLVVASCHLTLGVDDYKSIAKAACSCPETNAVFSDCEERVAERLAEASTSDVEVWIGLFQTLSCDECETQPLCVASAPVCREEGEACEKPIDCCETLEGFAYCAGGTCVREAPGCKRSFELCQDASDCCGSEGGLASCVQNGDQPGVSICVELCAPDRANCYGCCAGVESDTLGDTAICLGGSTKIAPGFPVGSQSCELACILGENEANCTEGTTCTSESVGSGTVDLCR